MCSGGPRGLSRAMRPVTPSLLHTVVAFSLGLSCTAGPDPTAPDVSPWRGLGEVPSAGSARYIYAWDMTGVEVVGEDGAWATMTDLGYRVTVVAGYVVSASVQLTACPADDSSTAWWRQLIGVPAARAGHGTEGNPAAVTQALVERLHATATREIGTVNALSDRLCGVHYLVGPADRDSLDLPESPQMVDRSLYLEGRWRAPGSDVEHPFVVDTAMSWGVLSELYPPGRFRDAGAQREVDTASGGVLVVIGRRAATMFDGIAFAEQTERTLPTRVLDGLLTSTELAIDLGDPARSLD